MILKKIYIPSEYKGRAVTVIAEDGFRDCEYLRKVVVASSVKTIENGAFLNCKKIHSISLSEGLTDIGGHVFTSSMIEEITIPASVNHIGVQAFCPPSGKIDGEPILLKNVYFKDPTGWYYNKPYASGSTLEAIPEDDILNSEKMIKDHFLNTSHQLTELIKK